MNTVHLKQVQAAALVAGLNKGVNRTYIGEPVSQLEHSLQCADHAVSAGADDSLNLAALFHDIGHLLHEDGPQLDGLGTLNHEEIGAEWLLRHGVDATIVHLVRHHVSAKRYLCYRYPKYLARLSSASLGTLQWQGGVMTAAEAEAFEGDPHFEAILQLRTFDERAKAPQVKTRPLAEFMPILLKGLHAVPMGSSGVQHV